MITSCQNSLSCWLYKKSTFVDTFAPFLRLLGDPEKSTLKKWRTLKATDNSQSTLTTVTVLLSS